MVLPRYFAKQFFVLLFVGLVMTSFVKNMNIYKISFFPEIIFQFCWQLSKKSCLRMQPVSEKFCLQWSDFRSNVSSAFLELRQDKDFTDVTLACEDGQQMDVHKVVLVSASPFFKNILKTNKHPHPMIYMRGLKSEDLVAVVDYMYKGEADVCQENLQSFLSIAQDLQLKGLKQDQNVNAVENIAIPKMEVNPFQETIIPSPQFAKGSNLGVSFLSDTDNRSSEPAPRLSLEEINQNVKSLMMFSENSAPGKTKGRGRKCKVCGKEGSMSSIVYHIESKHMPVLAIPCDLCEKSFSSRTAFHSHDIKAHK